MDTYDVKMSEGLRGQKRGREAETSSSSKQQSPSVDGITKRLEALGGLEPVGEYANKLVEIAVPKGDRVEYYPADYARTKFEGKVETKNLTKLITDADGTSRPLPQAYDSIKVPPGTAPQRAKEIRDGVWGEMQDELGFASKPSNGKTTWDKLDRNNEQAWYATPAGPHLTTYAWSNPEKAGQNLPELQITTSSSNSRGGRKVGVWRDDPMVAGMGIKQIAEKYGEEKVAIKNKNHTFRTVATLNERGEHEAERLFAQIAGNEVRYNRDLPDIVVQHKSHLVSVADIQNTKLWKAQPVLKQLNDALEQRPGSLRIAMSTSEGDSLHNPQLMQKLNSDRFDAICEEHNLPKDTFARNGKYLKGGPWVQTAEGLLQDASAVKERLAPGEKLTGKYKSTQIFGASKVVGSENKGSAKSLYATTRDNGPIPPEVARVLDMEPRLGGREEYKREAQQNRKVALESFANDSSSSVGGDATVKKEPNSDRQALVDGRQGERQAGVQR